MEKTITLESFADIIGCNIESLRYAGQGNRIILQFEGCEVKGDSVLIGEYGDGKSYGEARIDYCKKIKGKTIVLNAFSNKRTEFNVPKNLI